MLVHNRRRQHDLSRGFRLFVGSLSVISTALFFTLLHKVLLKSVPQTKFAAVMYHTDVSVFPEVLVNIRSLLDQSWTVRLFLPDCASCSFEAQKDHLLAHSSLYLLQQKGIETIVHPHDIENLHTNLNLAGIDDGYDKRISFLLANNFAMSQSTYEVIPEERMLFFQADVAFCAKTSSRSLESFMNHRWLGAPWLVHKSFISAQGTQINAIYGNGGVSVRSKSFAIGCLKRKQNLKAVLSAVKGEEGVAEDVFFSMCFFEHYGSEADIDGAISFSAEEKIVPAFPSLALHDPCRAAGGPASIGCETEETITNANQLLQVCPEASRIIAHCVSSCVDTTRP